MGSKSKRLLRILSGYAMQLASEVSLYVQPSSTPTAEPPAGRPLPPLQGMMNW
jgi:hypothetical protein